jgi:hypothetical protein
MLMMGFSRTSGIPRLESATTSMREQAALHHQARFNDNLAKANMMAEYNKRMRVKPSEIKIGSFVLIKRERTRKDISPWDPNEYMVTGMNGSMITVRREFPEPHQTTRNSSFFKLKRFDMSDEPAQGLQAQATVVSNENGNANIVEKQGGETAPEVVNEQEELPAVVPPPLQEQPTIEPQDEMPAEEQVDQVDRDEHVEQARVGVGRPTAEQAIANQATRAAAYEAKRALNPPTRKSSRNVAVS